MIIGDPTVVHGKAVVRVQYTVNRGTTAAPLYELARDLGMNDDSVCCLCPHMSARTDTSPCHRWCGSGHAFVSPEHAVLLKLRSKPFPQP